MIGPRFDDGREPRPLLMGARVEVTQLEHEMIRDGNAIRQSVYRRLFDLFADRLIRDHADQIEREHIDAGFSRVGYRLELLIMKKSEWRQITEEVFRLQEENRRLRLELDTAAARPAANAGEKQ